MLRSSATSSAVNNSFFFSIAMWSLWEKRRQGVPCVAFADCVRCVGPCFVAAVAGLGNRYPAIVDADIYFPRPRVVVVRDGLWMAFEDKGFVWCHGLPLA